MKVRQWNGERKKNLDLLSIRRINAIMNEHIRKVSEEEVGVDEILMTSFSNRLGI